MTILHVLYWISFIVQMIVYPAVINIDWRRRYGRIFGTRIDTDIYNKIFKTAFVCVCALFITIFIVG